MKRCVLSALMVVLNLINSAYGQAPARLPRSGSVQTDSTDLAKPRVVINPVFATGMKCDGSTDDSAALQSALAVAALPGLGNATIIMPPGTCMIDPAAIVSVNSSVWLQGAGKFGTILKRKNASSGSPLLLIRSSGVTLSDFGFDGNKGGPGIASTADSVAAGPGITNITIQRMRFVNSTSSDVASFVGGSGNFTTDWLIADSDFENQGNPASSCTISFGCANLFLQQPLRVRILGNRSDSSQNFVLFSSFPGGGQVEVGGNIISNLGGFGVALGGGTIGSTGAHVHDNFVTSNSTDPVNLIDLAFWNDFTVDHNILHHNGVATACIADFPPANHGEVDSNICYASPTTGIDVGIGLGGSDISITNNFIQGAAGAGISVAAVNARGMRIIGNTAKNNNQLNPGRHGGIELFVNDPDSPGNGTLSDVIIQGNHCYDDQPVKTQGYGIAIASYGQQTGYTNITMEGNDLIGNAVGGFLNNATAYSGFVIRNNPGVNPVGPIAAPNFPASGAGATVNSTGYDVTVYITSGINPIKVAINGAPVAGASVPGGGVPSGPIRLPANQNITLTYTIGGAPSWEWIAD
jgi:Pectate lyase superfamily protein